MAIKIVVPELGESVIEATVARWLKQPGEKVNAGEAVLVLETDKVDLEVAAEKSGVLTSIARQQGDSSRAAAFRPNTPLRSGPSASDFSLWQAAQAA